MASRESVFLTGMKLKMTQTTFYEVVASEPSNHLPLKLDSNLEKKMTANLVMLNS